MITRKHIFIFTVVSFLLVKNSLEAENIDEIRQTVAFLSAEKISTVKMGNKDYELWNRENDQLKALTQSVSGTGFFVKKGANIYLITANHVAADLQINVKVTIEGPQYKPITYNLNDFICNYSSSSWVSHNVADVSVVLVKPSINIPEAIMCVDFDLIMNDPQQLKKYTNRPVTIVGFPLTLGIKGEFSPIIKTLRISSGLFEYPRFDNNKKTVFFILDDPSTAGFSGAPVYALSGWEFGGGTLATGKFACIGIVHGNFNDPTGGKFAAITPANFIIETIEQYQKERLSQKN